MLSGKLTPIELFGYTSHPCVDSATYLVQVSSKQGTSGLVFIELEIENTSAIYDNMNSAYEFGVLNQHRKAVTYTIGCHSLQDLETNCISLMNTTERLKSSWHTFTTPNYFDYVDVAFTGATSSYFVNANTNMIVGYRIFSGNAKTASSFSGLTPISSCDTFMSNGASVSLKRFNCSQLLPNTTYSIQLIYRNDFAYAIKLGLFTGGTQTSSGPTATTTTVLANNIFGTLPSATLSRTDYFACNTIHSANSCGPTKPSTGVVFNNKNYDLSAYFTFNLAANADVNIQTAYTSPTTPICENILVRVFAAGITSSCNALTSGSLYDEFIGTKKLLCLPAGDYTIQVLSSSNPSAINNSDVTTATSLTCIRGSLGRGFSLSLTKSDALYDNMNGAYNFGILNQHRKVVSYNIGCHSVENLETLCTSIMNNNGDSLKTTWHTFTTPAYFDYIDMAFTGSSSFSSNLVVGYRVFQGNALVASNFSALTPITACDTFMSNGQTVSQKKFGCNDLLPNTTYSVQLIFKKNFNYGIKLGFFTGGTQLSSGPTASTTAILANNTFGTLGNGTVTRTDYFAYNTLHSINSCGTTKPSSGVVYSNQTYDLSTYFTFTLSTNSDVVIQSAVTSSPS
jgi:hypothetical protein